MSYKAAFGFINYNKIMSYRDNPKFSDRQV